MKKRTEETFFSYPEEYFLFPSSKYLSVILSWLWHLQTDFRTMKTTMAEEWFWGSRCWLKEECWGLVFVFNWRNSISFLNEAFFSREMSSGLKNLQKTWVRMKIYDGRSWAEDHYLLGYLEAHLCAIRETLSLLTGYGLVITESSRISFPFCFQMPQI